jgi:hypothetical protein
MLTQVLLLIQPLLAAASRHICLLLLLLPSWLLPVLLGEGLQTLDGRRSSRPLLLGIASLRSHCVQV